MITTTLNRCKEYLTPNLSDMIKEVFGFSQGDTPISFLAIAENIGVEAATSIARAEPQYADLWREVAGKLSEDLIVHMPSQDYLDVFNTVKDHAKGLATDKELEIARKEALMLAETRGWGDGYDVANILAAAADKDPALAVSLVAKGIVEFYAPGSLREDMDEYYDRQLEQYSSVINKRELNLAKGSEHSMEAKVKQYAMEDEQEMGM